MTEPEWVFSVKQKLELARGKALARDVETLSAYLDQFHEHAGTPPGRSDVLTVLGWDADRLENVWNVAVGRSARD